MATKKDSTPVLEIPENEDVDLKQESEQPAKAEEKTAGIDSLMEELERLKKENAKLKKDSVGGGNPAGQLTDYERVQEACKKAAEDGVDAWEVKISIRAPRRPKKEDPFYWLSVNGRTMQVPANDKYFELALPFAQCLTDMIAAEWAASDYIDSIEVFDPEKNPHRE